MYVNFKLASSRGVSIREIGALQMISQNKYEDLSELIEDLGDLTLTNLELAGYLMFVKGKKTNSKYKLMRVSDKAKSLLNDLEVPELNEDDLSIYTWLENIYKSTGRVVGNTRKTKSLIALFRVHSGIERNCLAILCQGFLNDESQFEWSKKLEYLFFKPPTLFSTKFDINQSRLFQYYEANKEMYDIKFEKELKKVK